MNQELTEKSLKEMLQRAGLAVKASYTPPEVCLILDISPRTFWRLTGQYERDEGGKLRRPDSLDSYTLSSHRRVRFDELVAFLVRNNTYQRQHAVDPNQMELPL
jgi:hypothetical protein